jgi:hypothetical protein
MMTAIVMPVPPTEKADRLQVSVHIQTEALSAEAARQEANYWLLENVGNLLRADNLELVLGEQLVWRIDIVLTSPTRGQVGVVGRIELDAITGEVLANETLTEELAPRAHALIAN